jgi:hypothetical protein
MTVILHEQNFIEYDEWIKLLSNIICIDISFEDPIYNNHEKNCSKYYSHFFLSVKSKFIKVFVENENYLRDENFLYVIISIFKNLPLVKIVEHEFLFKIFDFMYVNYERSTHYRTIFDALINSLEFEYLEEEKLLNFLNSVTEKFNSIVASEEFKDKNLKIKLIRVAETLMCTIDDKQENFKKYEEFVQKNLFITVKSSTEYLQNGLSMQPLDLEFLTAFFDFLGVIKVLLTLKND